MREDASYALFIYVMLEDLSTLHELVFHDLQQLFCDLHRIGCGTLSDVVCNDPDVETVFN